MTLDAEYLSELQRTIELRCRCKAVHRQTVFIHEKTADGETIWGGDVEVFDLMDYKESSRCYAWQDIEGGVRIVTILHSRLVDSPHRAVQAAIYTGIQRPMFAAASDRAHCKERSERVKKALYETQMIAEELEAAMQTVQRTTAPLSQRLQ
ncbi:MAG: hypothetical protein ACREE6_09240 [Limisphaerales bacterium]